MAILDILLLLILLLTLTALGRRLLKFAKVEFSSFIEEIVFSFGLGAGVIALLTLGIGLLGGFRRWLFYLLIFGLMGTMIFDVKAIILGAIRWLRNLAKKFRLVSLDGILLIVLALHFLLTLICALAPQTDFDSLVHHLTVPKAYIENGGIFDMSPDQGWYVVESSYPSNMEMLFTVGMLLRSDVLATLVAWAVSIFLVLSVYSLSRQFLSSRASLIAMVIVYCAPIITRHASTNDVDIGVAFFGLLALLGVLKWVYSGDHRFLLLSGVYAGFCAGTKYTGLPVVFVLAVLIIVVSILELKNGIMGVKYLLIFGAITSILAAPWYVRSYIYTGNPVYPFLAGVFGGESLPSVFSGHSASTPWKGVDDYARWYELPLSYMRFPWDLTMMRAKSAFNRPRNSIGVLYLLFIPCLLFIRNIDRRVKYLLFYGLLGLVIVFAVAQRARYMYAFVPPLAIVASYSLWRISEYDQVLKKVSISMLVVVALFSLVRVRDHTYRRFPVILGTESRESYLSEAMIIHGTVSYINKNLSDSDRVLSIDPRIYYSNVPCVYHWSVIDYGSIKNDETNLLEQMKDLNISHVLVRWILFRSRSRQGLYNRLAEQGKLKEIFKMDLVTLYETNYDD
ncbi:ArnT family glycosyltransferase [Candidatus Poribacteria bacterium]